MKFRSDLIDYLSKESGLPPYDEIPITIEEYYALGYKKPTLWVKVDDYEYQVSTAIRKGAVKVLSVRICSMDSPFMGEDFPLDYKFDEVFWKKRRSIDDFNVPYTIRPNSYKYCEGGGWHSMQDVIVINGKEFVNI